MSNADEVREDAQLTALRATGESADADDVATTHRIDDGLERLGTLLVVGLAGHHLDLLAVSLERVEEELSSGSTLQNDATRHRADLVLEVLSVLAARELLDELRKGVLDLELVGIVGVSRFLGLLDDGQSVLEVLGRVDVLLVLLLLLSGLGVGSKLGGFRGLLRGLLGLLLLFSSTHSCSTSLHRLSPRHAPHTLRGSRNGGLFNGRFHSQTFLKNNHTWSLKIPPIFGTDALSFSGLLIQTLLLC